MLQCSDRSNGVRTARPLYKRRRSPGAGRVWRFALESEDEIFSQLEKLVEDYESFQRLISVSKMEDVAAKYLTLIREAVQ